MAGFILGVLPAGLLLAGPLGRSMALDLDALLRDPDGTASPTLLALRGLGAAIGLGALLALTPELRDRVASRPRRAVRAVLAAIVVVLFAVSLTVTLESVTRWCAARAEPAVRIAGAPEPGTFNRRP